MTTALALQNADACNRACIIAARFAGVEGWLHPAQGFALHELARLGDGDGAVVEIGSFMGLSACWLATGLKEAGRGCVYCVDTFAGVIPYATVGGMHEYGNTFPVFEKNLRARGLFDNVLPILSESVPAAAAWKHGPIRLLFIDAGHEYEEIKADFEAWAPLLAPGAIVAIHDVGDFEGVTRFYEEILYRRPCKVCAAVPDNDGVITHGKGCYTQSEDGGGEEFVDPPEWREVLRVGSLGVIQR